VAPAQGAIFFAFRIAIERLGQSHGKRVCTYTHGCSTEHAKALFQLNTDKVPTHDCAADSSFSSARFFLRVCGEVRGMTFKVQVCSVLPTRVWGGALPGRVFFTGIRSSHACVGRCFGNRRGGRA